jgi:predicted ATPase/DNA-binding NarL/FixJ family response regulator
MRVLIADDSAVERLLARSTVEKLGHDCLLAEDGEQAWQIFQDYGADVIMSDWVMPELDGAGLCRRVRASTDALYTYVILLTVLDDKDHALAGMRAGADEYLAKPLDGDALEKALIAAERVTTLHQRMARQQAGREQTLARRDAMLALAGRLASHGDPERLLSDLLDRAVDIFDACGGAIGRWHDTEESLVSIHDTQRAIVGPELRQVSHAAMRYAAHRRGSIGANEEAPSGLAPLAVPLVHEGRLLGALSIVAPAGRQRFSDHDAEALTKLAAMGAAALVGLDRARMAGALLAAHTVAADEVNRATTWVDAFANNTPILPSQPTRLIGRATELETVRTQLLRPEVRMVTLTGPAGVGKTRLALAAAASLQDAFADGVHWIDLAPLDDPAQVVPSLARALGIRSLSDVPLVESLRRALDKQQLLIVLDNFEHVQPAAASIDDVLRPCGDVKLIVTSRSCIRLSWEHVVPVPPLGLPRPGARDIAPVAEAPAVQLYVERMQAADPDFALSSYNAPAVADACARLDGLPLAIELAAARGRVLPPGVLASRLESTLSVLGDGYLDLPKRQQTLRAAIAWSYNLLGRDEQRLFRQAGVFAGGFTCEAAATVCQTGAGRSPEMVNKLAILVENNLLCHEPRRNGELRFRMLETIREYALEQLAACGELDDARARHAGYFTGLAEMADAEILAEHQGSWLDRLELEHANLRAALRYTVEACEADLELRLAGALARFWYLRGYLREGSDSLEAALARHTLELSYVHANALAGAASLASADGDWELAETRLETSQQFWRQVADERRLALALADLAYVRLRRRDLAGARALSRESLALARDRGDRPTLACALQRAAEVALGFGTLSTAQDLFGECFSVARRLGHPWRAAAALEGLAVVAAMRGEARNALRLNGTASRLRTTLGTPLSPIEQQFLNFRMASAHELLGESASAEALALGHATPLDQVSFDGGSADDDDTTSLEEPVLKSTVLSRREREVAPLVGKGFSNRQISAQLRITERTAEAHVSNILHKLELTSRAQLAVWVMKHARLVELQVSA